MKIVIPTREEAHAALAQGVAIGMEFVNRILGDMNDLLGHAKAQAELIQTLQVRLDKDSHNSSKPPSTDGYKKPPPKSLRKAGQNPNGGQPGHEGKTLTTKENPDRVEDHFPEHCKGCAEDLSGVEAIEHESRQVFEIPAIEIEVTEHRAQQKICMKCGTVNCGEFPKGVSAAVQYGDGVMSFCTYMNNEHHIPLKRTTQIFNDLFQQHISEASVLKSNHTVSERVKPAEEAVKELLIKSAVAHADESGIRVKAKLHWLHDVSTEKLTHYSVHAKRGKEAMDAAGIISKFKGVLVHDHWKPYFSYTECDHGACNTHHLRELIGIAEGWEQPWATNMMTVLCDINDAVNLAKKKDATHLDEKSKVEFVQRYNQVLEAGYAANPVLPDDKNAPKKKGRKKQSTPLNLLDRLRDFKSDTLRFMNDFRVPFSNNLSERDIRMIKTKTKVSGGFRTLNGAEQFARIRGYISTARKNGQNILASIKDAIAGKPFIPAVS